MIASVQRNFKADQLASLNPGLNLNSKHYQELVHRRGLNLHWVQINCHSVDAQTASEQLGYRAYSSGILLKGVGSQEQFKPDTPWKSQDGKRPKYRSCRDDDGYDAMLPAHPDHPQFWDDLEELKNHCYWINDVPFLVITEGFFKAIALTSNGVATIAILGVEQGLTSGKCDPQGKRYLVEILERFARAGFGLIIAFDADCARKRGVIEAQLKLAHQLCLFQVPVYSITGLWHEAEGKGIDDYIQMNGYEQFRDEVLSKAETIEAWKEKHLAVLEKQFHKSTHPHSPNEIAKEIAEDYFNQLAFNNETGVWMRYEAEEKGVWSPETDTYIESIVSNILDGKNIKVKTHNYIVNVVKSLKICPGIIKRKWLERSPSEVLPFHNGVLDIATGRMLEHSPENYLTWSIPRQHNPEAKDWNSISEWLDFVSQGNKAVRNLLICFANAVLKGRSDLQKFMHLIGLGGSGKGTYSRLLIDLIGLINTCSTSAELFCTNRFEPINAYRKRLLLFADEQVLPKNISNLMKAVGGDHLRGEQKNKPAFQFKFDGMALMISEHPIAQGTKGNGWKRRVISLPMNVKVADQKRRDLNKDFQPELAAFTNYLLSLDDEFVTETLRGAGSSAISQLSFWQSRIREDSIAAWLNDRVIYDPCTSTPVGRDKNEADQNGGQVTTLFGSYSQYCQESGNQSKAIKNFSPDLIELCQSILDWDVQRVRNESHTRITGLRLRNEVRDHSILTHEQSLVELAASKKTSSCQQTCKLEPPIDKEPVSTVSPTPNWIAGQHLKIKWENSRYQNQVGEFQKWEKPGVAIVSGLQPEPIPYPVEFLEATDEPLTQKKPLKPAIAKLTDSEKDDWLYRNRNTKKAIWVELDNYTGVAKLLNPGSKSDTYLVDLPDKWNPVRVEVRHICVLQSQLGKFKPKPQPPEGEQVELNLETVPENETPAKRFKRLAKKQGIKLKPGDFSFDSLLEKYNHSNFKDFTDEEFTEISDVWEQQIKNAEKFMESQSLMNYLDH
ncbi:MAG: DUF3854 domain-containing protein [Cyanobacteria bacterium J06592_8]